MHFAQLQSQMTRYHENIRPRYQNPTYVSSNVGGSLGTTIYRTQSTHSFGTKSLILPTMKQQTSRKQIGLNTENAQDSSRKSEASSRNRKSSSNLSNYGTTSLGPMKKYISDKEVYQKQQKKYNIVTIQPKQYVDTIKIFPKYRLENSDANYYKKLVIQNQISSKKNPVFEHQPRKMDEAIDKKLDLNPENAVKSNLPTKPFRGKLLNNIDEIAGIL